MNEVWTEVSLDKRWGYNAPSGAGGSLNSWEYRNSGAGVVSSAGDILTTSSSAGDASMVDYYIPVLPGQTIEVSVLGRLVSGAAGVYIDAINYNGSFSPRESRKLNFADWKEVKLRYTMPIKADSQFVRVVIGVVTADTGHAEWQLPSIRVCGGLASQIIMARGLIHLQAGTPVMHPTMMHFGVASLAFNGTDTLTVTLVHDIMGNPSIRPILLVNGTLDNPLVPLAGTIDPSVSPPTFKIKWSNGTAFQNVAALDLYVPFQLAY